MQKTKSQLFRDSFWSAVSAAASALFGIVYLVAIGNHWRSEALGVFTLAFSIYMLSAAVISAGIHNAVLFRAALAGENSKAASLAVYTGLAISLLFGIVGSGCFFGLIPVIGRIFQHDHLIFMLKILSVALVFFVLNKTLAGILNAAMRMRMLAVIDIARGIIIGAGIFLLIGLEAGYTLIPYGVLVAEICLSVFMLFDCLRRHRMAGLQMSEAKQLIGFGWKTTLLNIMADFDLRLDILFVGHFAEASIVGVYSVASTIAKGFWLLPNAVQKVTNPLIVSLYSEGNLEKIHRIVDVVARLGTMGFFILGCLLVVLIEPVVKFAFPHQPDLHLAVYPLYLLLPGTIVFTGIAMLASAPCASIGRPENSVKYITIRILINAVLNAILVPFFFDKGAAAATTFALIGSLLYYAHLFKRYLGFQLPLKFLFLLCAAFCMVAFLKFTLAHLPLVAAAVIAGFVPLFILWLYRLDFISREDNRLILSILPHP
jgi:O-antigen/teichoic acid export membrane protein